MKTLENSILVINLRHNLIIFFMLFLTYIYNINEFIKKY